MRIEGALVDALLSMNASMRASMSFRAYGSPVGKTGEEWSIFGNEPFITNWEVGPILCPWDLYDAVRKKREKNADRGEENARGRAV